MGSGCNIYTISVAAKETGGPVCTKWVIVYQVKDKKQPDEGTIGTGNGNSG